ncbi:MAG TPA: hypothetical protein VK604_09580 [Bryobacteraceae bacterium]|nr:hypothetical protein [Bryobacteraceae bacterium]
MIAYFRFCTIAILLLIGISTCAAKARQSSQSNEPESTKAYASKWVGLSTPHFELYTTNEPQAALEAVQRLEMVHSFFRQAGADAGLFGAVPEAAVQVIAFRSAREYSAHRVNPTACAYYQRTRSGDYIVMQDLAPDHYQVGVHEYTHFLFQHSGLKLPLWLNEGLAEFYSSLESRNGQVFLGRPPFGRLHSLRTQSWLSLTALFSVAQGSPYYTQADKMAIFYAESWALTHMLAMDAQYAPQFSGLLTLISNGTPAPEAFQTLYHKSPDQVTADLNNYLQQRQLPVRVFDWSAAPAVIQPKFLPSPLARVDFALADLAASNPYSGLGAAGQLDEVSKKYPEDPEAEESLGFLALRQNRPSEARVHFAKAVERHSVAPDALFYLAHLDLNAGAPAGPIVELLQRVLVLDPSHYNAHLDLGFAQAKANRFDLAVVALNSIPNVRPEHAYLIAYTLGYCYIQMHRAPEAQTHAEKAQRLAGSDADRRQTDQLLRYIENERVRAKLIAAN